MSRSHPPTTVLDAHPPRSPLRCHPADELRSHEHVAKKPDVYYSIPVAGIDDAVFQGLSRFEETKLTDDAIGFDPTSVLGALKSGENPLFVDDSGTTKRGWVGWPDTARSETQTQTQTREGSQRMKQDFVQYINRIGQAVAESTGRSDVPRKWSAKYCRSVVPGSNGALKPDFVLMRSDNADSPDTAQHGWRSIFAVGVIASRERTTSHARITTLASYAAKMFIKQPDRRYVLGFSVDEDRVEYVLFNRSGVYISDAFNVHNRPERLVRVVAGMMFARRGAMGFDPSMKLTLFDETEPTEAYIEVDKKRYPFVELLSVEGTIRSRSTTVYAVDNPEWDGGTKDGYLVVKRQWVTRDKVKEYAILNELRDVPYIPKVVAFQVSGDSETSRADFDEWRMSHLPEGEDIDSMVARMDCLVEVRMTITLVGESLLHFRSLKELVHVFITIVDAIGALHEKGYLHYDISASNVMIDISDPTTKGLRNGLLTD